MPRLFRLTGEGYLSEGVKGPTTTKAGDVDALFVASERGGGGGAAVTGDAAACAAVTGDAAACLGCWMRVAPAGMSNCSRLEVCKTSVVLSLVASRKNIKV